MSAKALSALLQDDSYTMAEMADGTGVLLDLRRESLLTFNDTSTFMFERIKAGDNEEAIVAKVHGKYEVDEVVARIDVSEFILQLGQALGLK